MFGIGNLYDEIGTGYKEAGGAFYVGTGIPETGFPVNFDLGGRLVSWAGFMVSGDRMTDWG